MPVLSHLDPRDQIWTAENAERDQRHDAAVRDKVQEGELCVHVGDFEKDHAVLVDLVTGFGDRRCGNSEACPEEEYAEEHYIDARGAVVRKKDQNEPVAFLFNEVCQRYDGVTQHDDQEVPL